MVQKIQLSHLPPELPLYVALYRNLQNAEFLKQQLLAGNSDFEYALVDASMLVSTNHALAAAFRATNDFMNNRLKSRNVHSEIVFALSPNNNIGEAFRRFGIGDSTRDLLVVKVPTSSNISFESVEAHLKENIKGDATTFDDFNVGLCSDLAKIKKAYKLGGPAAKPLKNQVGGHLTCSATDEVKEVETAVIGAVALRGAT